jgi:hypothetical protein
VQVGAGVAAEEGDGERVSRSGLVRVVESARKAIERRGNG